MRLGDGYGGTMTVRRITVELDTPTRDGETEIHILTNLPAEVADARMIADLYRRRWSVEAAFGELATCLNGEIDTLGYPKAALFAFCVALVSYEPDERGEGGASFGPRARPCGRGAVVLLPGRRGGRDAPGDDDRHPGGRVGGVPRADGGGVRGDPAGPGRRGPLGGLPQAGPWPEASAAEAGERGEDQARLHCEATGEEEREYITPPSKPCFGIRLTARRLTGSGEQGNQAPKLEVAATKRPRVR